MATELNALRLRCGQPPRLLTAFRPLGTTLTQLRRLAVVTAVDIVVREYDSVDLGCFIQRTGTLTLRQQIIVLPAVWSTRRW